MRHCWILSHKVHTHVLFESLKQAITQACWVLNLDTGGLTEAGNTLSFFFSSLLVGICNSFERSSWFSSRFITSKITTETEFYRHMAWFLMTCMQMRLPAAVSPSCPLPPARLSRPISPCLAQLLPRCTLYTASRLSRR